LPEWVYYPWKRGDRNGCQIFTRPNGDVIWLVQAENHYIAFKIHGWDKVRRYKGTVNIVDRPTAPKMQGTGLRGTYFRGDNFGQPISQRIDDRLQFGKRYVVDSAKPWNLPEQLTPNSFSVEWEGFLEVPRTEAYQFSVGLTGTVKVWIDGQLVIEASQNNGTAQSAPIEMIAGRKTPIEVQFISNSDKPLLQLYWESMIQDRLTVPTAALYPDRY